MEGGTDKGRRKKEFQFSQKYIKRIISFEIKTLIFFFLISRSVSLRRWINWGFFHLKRNRSATCWRSRTSETFGKRNEMSLSAQVCRCAYVPSGKLKNVIISIGWAPSSFEYSRLFNERDYSSLFQFRELNPVAAGRETSKKTRTSVEHWFEFFWMMMILF